MFDSPFRSTIGSPPSQQQQQQQQQQNPFKRILSPARPSLDEENQENRRLDDGSSMTLLLSSSSSSSSGNPNGNNLNMNRNVNDNLNGNNNNIDQPLVKRNKFSNSPAIMSRIRSKERALTPTKIQHIMMMKSHQDNVDQQQTTTTTSNEVNTSSSTSILDTIDPIVESRNQDEEYTSRQQNDDRTKTKVLVPRENTTSSSIKTLPRPQQQSGSTMERDRTFKMDVTNKPSMPSSSSSSSSITATNTNTRTTTTSRVTAGKTTSAGNIKKLGNGTSPIPMRRTATRFTAPDEVKATDEGYASVAKLSEWLASDPTSTKKKRHIRLGKNIIAKSRKFEIDQANIVIMESNNISRGAVSDKKKWLQTAFRQDGDPGDEDRADSVTGSRYAKSEILLRSTNTASSLAAYYNHQARGVGNAVGGASSIKDRVSSSDSRSEIITNDAASSLSVSDKKDWLMNAFVTKTETNTSKVTYGKAQTDIMHSRDEAATRAKMKFKERSARKLLNGDGTSTHVKVASRDTSAPLPIMEDHQLTNPIVRDTRSHTSSSSSSKLVADDNDVPKVDEDTSNVDFRAAREALVQRSKQNGHKVQIVNKVYLRKTKLEKMEEVNRRKSQPMGGSLKPSWDIPKSKSGRPSNVAYERSHNVEDNKNIAPNEII